MKVDLSPEEARRYSKHLVLPEFGREGQKKLKRSSILVVGVGGLGVPATIQLVSAGVGEIGLVDSDVVELSNLQRQFIFSETDIGLKKVEVAESRLRRMNPNVHLEAIDAKLTPENAMKIISDYEVIIDATDNIPGRYLINDACVLGGKPDVYASVLAFEGMVSVFDAKKGPCYRCLFPEPPPPGSVKSCVEAGVSNVVAGVMGTLQANQALNILLGIGTSLTGRLLFFNGLENSFEEVRMKKNASCPACSPSRSFTELIDYNEFCGVGDTAVLNNITPEELKALMDRGQSLQLVDVREPSEYAICRIEGSKPIPLGFLREQLHELKNDSPIIVYCHHGFRSANATAVLKQAGFSDVRNLEGGIEAWTLRIDTKMARY